jgi:hypothetical protein
MTCRTLDDVAAANAPTPPPRSVGFARIKNTRATRQAPNARVRPDDVADEREARRRRKRVVVSSSPSRVSFFLYVHLYRYVHVRLAEGAHQVLVQKLRRRGGGDVERRRYAVHRRVVLVRKSSPRLNDSTPSPAPSSRTSTSSNPSAERNDTEEFSIVSRRVRDGSPQREFERAGSLVWFSTPSG